MSDEDPVLTELDRRIALAEAATQGPWILANECRLNDSLGTVRDYASVLGPRRHRVAHGPDVTLLSDAQFIVDARAHRLRELRALKAAWELLRATNQDCSEHCPCCYIEGIIERAILGNDGER